MHRRRFLSYCAAGALGTLAGCSGTADSDSGTPTIEAAGQHQPRQPRQPLDDVDLPVPSDELDWRLAQDSISAIVEPSFAADWSGLSTDDAVRAYPFPVVADEDIVNDTVGDRPVVVTVAPDGTLAAYDRRVGGERLDRADDHPPMFWIGWSKFNPDTGVYGIEDDPNAG